MNHDRPSWQTIGDLLGPILIGKRLKLHMVLAFIALVGGLMVFGPAGLILGPITLTITTVLVEIWRNRTAATEMPNTGPDELFSHDHCRCAPVDESPARIRNHQRHRNHPPAGILSPHRGK